jgi:DNA-directed RNA polymerase specialized sigma24 family protein/CheY-like chemotaxis protein
MHSSIADLVAPQLPYLRRFARALTGSQERGDAYVVATLETLVTDSRIFSRDASPKVALYQVFLHVWNAIPINHRRQPLPPVGTEDGAGAIVDRRIETLTPRPRQAFLLAALEEFAASEISVILDVKETEVHSLIDVAGKEISEQIAATVLIIEDEPLIALDLETLVSDIGHDPRGVATTRQEATMMARRVRPGIVLADIQLADGSSGIEAVNDILKEMDVPVIFITAYPERLLTGERAEPTFVITKPFRPEMVKAVISQALFFDMRAGNAHHGVAA